MNDINPKVAFAICAHPDDIEFLMSGTLMRLGRVGYELHYMNIATGCCGSTTHNAVEAAGIRRTESQAAANFIGATFHQPLCNDLEVFYDQPTLAKLTAIIRKVAPDILLTHSPTDYMEDHTTTCRLAVTSAFCRGMPNYPTTPVTAAIEKPVTVYHAQPYSHYGPLGELITPSCFIDVSALQARKREMLALHQSQKQWLDESQGLDSYLNTMQDLDRQLGTISGKFEYAEGWRKHNHLGFCGPNADPLSEALGIEP
ncbi:MAG: LmbE family protein [Planctomycetaceae bacterium]|nr:LmbE family protein [Planctomycetaceae bacterium]MBT7917550.1 LmbE family protein [Planctomycetaceae bacterium]